MTHAKTALQGMLDRLHGAPLADFVALRKTLASELKERGDKPSADALLATKKPPVTAWALNQVALHHHAEIEAFLAATEKLRAAQQRALAGDEASDFRESGRELQRQLNAVVALAKKALDQAGHAATTTQLRRIGQSLHSTAFAAPSDLARLAAGHLEADLDVPVDFGVFAPEEGVPRLAEEDEEAAAAKKKSDAHTKKPKKSPTKEPPAAPAEPVESPAQREAEKQRAAAAALAKKEEEKRAAQNKAHQARELREARAEATVLAKKAEAASKRAALLDKAAKIHERKAESARQAADHAAESARLAEAAASAAAERAASLRD